MKQLTTQSDKNKKMLQAEKVENLQHLKFLVFCKYMVFSTYVKVAVHHSKSTELKL